MNAKHQPESRSVDHCVLPVQSLETATRRFSQMGFTVAPAGNHPFGTQNACIYFADNTFIELLVIRNELKYEKAVLQGNPFVSYDQAFRFRHGNEGFSAVAFKSEDAGADHRKFRKSHISAGRTLRFSRSAGDGKAPRKRVSFKLGFARDLRSPDILYFVCERVRAVDFSATHLVKHENGATGIGAIVLSAPEPRDHLEFLCRLVENNDASLTALGFEIAAGNTKLAVLNGEGMKSLLGLGTSDERGLQPGGLVIQTRDMSKTLKYMENSGVEIQRMENRAVVHAAPGQGTAVAFEAHG